MSKVYGYDIQEELISGTNIKTIDSQSILGEGNINVGANKADKVVAQSGEVLTGKLAGLDENGNLTNSGVASSDVAKLSANNTFTGNKNTFNTVVISRDNRLRFKHPTNSSDAYDYTYYQASDGLHLYGPGCGFLFDGNYSSPNFCATKNSYNQIVGTLGTSDLPWKDIYLTGKINPVRIGSTSDYAGIILPDTTGWTTDKTVATLDDILSYSAGTGISINASNEISVVNADVIAGGIQYSATAPTSVNNDGLKVVVLNSEPLTRYSGYIYIITGSNQ